MTAIRAGHIGSSVRPNEVEGPVVAASEIEIAAPVDVVWDVLTNIERWPSWNPEVKSASLRGDVVPGSVFRWKTGPGKITSTIRRVAAPDTIAWTGKTFGVAATHVWRLERRGDRTLARTEEAFTGPLARLLRRSLQKTLDEALANGLGYLKTEAEARARDATPARPHVEVGR